MLTSDHGPDKVMPALAGQSEKGKGPRTDLFIIQKAKAVYDTRIAERRLFIYPSLTDPRG